MTTKEQLSTAEQKTLGALMDILKEQGFPPTLRQIAARTGVGSASTILTHLRGLEAKGWIRRTGQARAIQVIES